MGKKLLSMAIAIVMIASLFTGMMVAKAEVPAGYIVYDDFGAGDVSGWAHVTNGSTASNTITPVEITDDSGNYALVYHDNYTQSVATEKGEFVYREIPNGGIAYEEGKNIIIETRTMFTSANSFCSLKLNLPTDINSLDNAEAGNCQYSIWTFIGTDAGWFGWGNDPFSGATIPFSGVPFNNRWFTTEIVIKGTTNTADVTVTEDATGLSVTKTDLPLTGPLSTTHLKNVTFRSYNSDDDIYVDYLKIKEQRAVKTTVGDTVKPEENIVVNFTSGDAGFVDAVTLKDEAGNSVLAQNSFDAETTSVIIDPVDDLTLGAKYTVVINKEAIGNAGYIYSGKEEFSLKVSLYIVDEDYSDGDVGGWVLGEEGKGTLGTELIEGSNYAVVFNDNLSSTGQGKVSYYVNRVINGDTGIVFEDGKNVVIEIRTRHTATGGGALHLKMNMVPTWTEYGNFQYAIWNMFAKELRYGDVPWSSYTANFEAVEKGDYLTGWFTTTIVIDGTTNKATVTIKEDASGKIDTKKVDLNDTDINPNSATEPFTALKNLSFRSLNEPDTVYIDYLKVYEQFTTEATVQSTVKVDGNVEVKFTKGAEGIENAVLFTDASGVSVSAAKSYDADTKTVTIDPVDNLTQGNIYKVTIDKSVVETLGYALIGANQFSVKASSYIVDIDFDETSTSGWQLVANNGVQGEQIVEDLGDGNYALKIYGTSTNIASKYVINGDEGVAIEDGKNIVIETKFKNGLSTGGVSFKIPDLVEQWGNSEMFNNYGAVANIVEGKGVHSGTLPMYADFTYDVSTGNKNADAWSSNNLWYTVTVEYLGATGRANVTIVDENGETITHTNIPVPINDYIKESTPTYVAGTAIKEVGFRALSNGALGGSSATGTIYVDYLRVYEKQVLKVLAPEVVTSGQNEVDVILNSKATNDTFKNYVKLYKNDGTTLVTTTNRYDATTKVVTLVANDNFEDGETYIVKIDKEAISALGIDVSTIADSYTVTVSKYIVNDTFENNLSGWTLYQEGQGNLNYTNDGLMEFSNTEEGRNKQIAIKQFPAPIVHKDGKYTVVETRIKNTTGDAMTSFKVNINPEYNTNWEQERNNYTLFAINLNGNTKNHSFMYPNGKATAATGNVLLTRMWDVAPDTVNGTWFKVEARFDGSNPNFVLLTVTNEDTNVTSTTTADMRAWDDANADYSTLKSFAVRMGTGGIDTAYVDYVRVSYEDKEEVTPDYEVAIVNAAGEEVTSLTAGETYYCHYKATAEELTNVSFIYALYKNDELVNMSVESRFVLNHSDRSDSGFRIAAAEDTVAGDVYSLKAFAWSDLTGLKPLTTAATAKTE